MVQALTGPQWFLVAWLVTVAFCTGGLVEANHRAAADRRRMRERQCH